MMHSLSAQVSYYSKLIQDNPNWQYCGVYADESKTGTKDSRPEFQRLLNDCKQGKIDMIITKSISRFARNTLTVLETVRELKKLGIDVYFEKENIHSLSEEGELMLTLLSSFAQEESLSVSENCKWRIRDKFKQGISTNFKMLGYELKDNQITVIPKEAKIVKMIFQDYLSGMGINAIARKLMDKCIPTKDGGIWQCNNKFKNKNKCKTPHLTEEQIKEEFVKAFNNLISNKDEVIKDCENTVLTLINTEDIDSKISKLQQESEIIVELMKNLIYENSRKVMNQDEYNKKYNSYTEKYEKIKSELSKLEDKKQDLKVRRDRIKIFIENLKSNDKIIDKFDERLWYALVQKVVVNTNKEIEVKFKN